jgi:hypothetical protein
MISPPPDADARAAGIDIIQRHWRRSLAFYKVKRMVQQHQEELEAMQHKSISLGGKRVQPWSAESAELALRELGGKVSKQGVVLWPKGTVEKLLMERTKYMDVVTQQKRKAARIKKAAAQTRDVVNQTMSEVEVALRKKKRDDENDPKWTGALLC